MILFLKEFSIEAAVGQLWELTKEWTRLIGDDHCESYILVRRIGETDVWDALHIETNKLVSVTLSSLLYDRVA